MVDDGLKYEEMVERALRGVLREALGYVAEQGLPGDHHLYITFRTDHADVDVPDRLRERYPSEMTIVLQYQFWGLEVSQDGFAVTLTFSDVPERLVVPFDAVIAFADPSVRFGLQFDTGTPETEAKEGPSADIEPLPVDKIAPPKVAKVTKGSRVKDAPGKGPAGAAPAADKVITLDTFRKK